MEEINEKDRLIKCARCERELPTSEFWKRTSKKRGYQSRCKQCLDLYRKTPEMVEKRKVWTDRWRENNPDKVKAQSKRRPNTPRILGRMYEETYRRKNRKNAWKRSQDWARRHPEKLQEYREKRRLNSKNGSMSRDEWKSLKEKYGNKCVCCGRHENEVLLHADHVVPVKDHGTNNVDNRQPLCHRCNSRKKDKTIDYRPKE
jgi:hypothetical protein